MIIRTDTTKIKTPDEFGEILRKYFFLKNSGLGCYQNFWLEAYMIKEEPPQKIKDFFGDCENTIHYYVYGFASEGFVAWQWDGDGYLIVSDGERIAGNSDCKKTHGWKWL
jgi:hypothetical protein